MTIDKFKRVVWRLQEKATYTSGDTISLSELRRAIMQEIGTDERTIIHNIAHMKEIGYIKQLCRYTFIINKED